MSRSNSLLPPALAAVLMIFVFSGCFLQRERIGPGTEPAALLHDLRSRNAGLTTLRAEAEASVSFAGRMVVLPSALVMRHGLFRMDMLDPLDRPAAILFAEGGRLVQYRPSTALAAAVNPLPRSCGGLAVESWLEPLLDGGADYPATGAAGESFRRGKDILERYHLDEIVETIRFVEKGEGIVPWKVTRYCGGVPAIKGVLDDYRPVDTYLIPHSIEVEYPAARLAMELRLQAVEVNPAVERSVFSPVLPPGTVWKKWSAVHEPL